MEATTLVMRNPALHIVGCGDIGRRVAARLQGQPWTLNAWVRSETSCRACEKAGLHTRLLDLDQPLQATALTPRSRLLYTVPPPSTGQQDTRLENFLASLDPQKVDRFVLISTSGVYGDCGGEWVDESTPICPVVDRALRRADAETQLQRWAGAHDIDWIILRVPGIYAPDRLPLARLRSGAPLVARGDAPWSNRIHADDLAAACQAALELPVRNEIINITDDAPSTMTDYFLAVADYAGLPRPAEIPLQAALRTMSAGMQSYMAESRRVRNDKMKKLLGIELRYPSLEQGLKHGQV